jgi:hypothetical protein
MPKKDSSILQEGLLASLLSLLSFGKQIKMLRRLQSATKDPELEAMIHDYKFTQDRYKDQLRRIKKKYPEIK